MTFEQMLRRAKGGDHEAITSILLREDNVGLFAGVSGGNFRFQIAGTYLLPTDAEKLVGVGHFHPEKKV